MVEGGESFQIQQISKEFARRFVGIDLSDARSELERDNYHKTRALAAFSLTKLGRLSVESAEKRVTDGFGDNGIDAIFYDDTEKTLFLIQSKWKNSGNGCPELGDLEKFISGFNRVIGGELDGLNEKFQPFKPEILEAIETIGVQFHLVLAYTSDQPLGTDQQLRISETLGKYNTDGFELVKFTVLTLKQIYGLLAEEQRPKSVDLDLVIKNWAPIEGPLQGFVAQVDTTELGKSLRDLEDAVFFDNVRTYLRETDVNRGIASTLKVEPKLFSYLNNGITVLCEGFERAPKGGDKRGESILRARGAKIINGAQTVGTIMELLRAGSIDQSNVLVKFISLQGATSDFSEKVIRASNTQNRIEARDFVKFDPNQERLRVEMGLEGYFYAYRAGEPGGTKSHRIELDEVTVAVACSHYDVSYPTLAKNSIGTFYLNISDRPYTLIFNSGMNARKAINRVLVMREVDKLLEVFRYEHRQFDSWLTHGNRFVLHLVLRSMKEEDLNTARIEDRIDEVKTMAEAVFRKYIDYVGLRLKDSYPATFFKNASRCKTVVDHLFPGAGGSQLVLNIPS